MDSPSADDRTRDRMLHGPLGLVVLRLGLPVAASMALQVLFNLVDQYLIARLPRDVADASLDALGICDMIAALGTIVSYGLSSAAATLVAQARGRGDDRAASEAAWGSVGLVTVLGLVFGALALVGADFFVGGVMGAKGAVRVFAAGYLRVIVGGIVTVFLMFQVTAVQRALGQTKRGLVLFAAGNVLNLLFAVVLVYGPGPAPAVFAWGPPIARALGLPAMGVVGAAWGTVLARAVVIVIPVLQLRRSLRVDAFGAKFLPARAVMKRLVDLAWPTSTQLVVRIGAVLLVIALVHRYFTTDADSAAGTAYALCLRMETLALFVSMGWGSAAQTVVGTNVGAGNPLRARRGAWTAAGFCVATMAGLAVLFVDEGERFLRFFTPEAGIVARAMAYLVRVGPSYTFFGLAIVLANGLVGAGATRLALKIDASLVLLVQLPLTVFVASRSGAQPTHLWTALVLTNVLSAVVYALVARRRAPWSTSVV